MQTNPKTDSDFALDLDIQNIQNAIQNLNFAQLKGWSVAKFEKFK